MTIIHDFDDATEGGYPHRRPIVTADGRLVGTARVGPGGGGTVYRVHADGTGFEVLYAFNDLGVPALFFPDRLAQASDGTIYGVVRGDLGNDAIFAIAPDGTFRVAHDFAVDGSEAYGPISLVADATGGVWGTSSYGGTANYGAAWHISSTGAFNVVHNFTSADGSSPELWLLSADGSLYGTAFNGGPYGSGTIFHMTPAGQVDVVYGFGRHASEGYAPVGLLRTGDGTFYGVTEQGGEKGGLGTVYRLSPSGILTTLHDFGASFGNGNYPTSDGLAIGDDGSLYGTCSLGGLAETPDYVRGMGTVFRVVP